MGIALHAFGVAQMGENMRERRKGRGEENTRTSNQMNNQVKILFIGKLHIGFMF